MICVTHILRVILLTECNVDTDLAIWTIVQSNLGKGQVKSGHVRFNFEVIDISKRWLSVSVFFYDEINNAFFVSVWGLELQSH